MPASRRPEVKLVDATDRKPSTETIKMLEGLLEHAKSGELRTLIVCAGWADDAASHSWVLDSRNDARRLLGCMALAQFDLLATASLQDIDSIISQLAH